MKIAGLICLILGIVSAATGYRQLSSGNIPPGSAAYQAGYRRGRIGAPVALIGLGVYLLTRNTMRRERSTPSRPSGLAPIPPRPVQHYEPEQPMLQTPQSSQIPVKVNCACGQNYSFEVEPVAGRMPAPVQCPVCGADGTEAANQVIAATLASQVEAMRSPRMKIAPAPVPPRSAEAPWAATAPPRGRPIGGASASNPALLDVSVSKLLATGRWELWLALGCLPGSLILGMIAGQLPIFLFGGFLTGLYFFWSDYRVTKAKFMSGDVCPAVVISDRPWLVAVTADMSATGGLRKPAVKILRQPLAKMTGGPAAVGMRLATTALYQGPPRNGVWRDFMPEVINCGVTDESEIQRVMYSISEQEWQALDDLVARMPKTAPGLYFMWGANAGVPVRGLNPALQRILAVLILAPIAVAIAFGVQRKWRTRAPQSQQSSAPVRSTLPTSPRVEGERPLTTTVPPGPRTPRRPTLPSRANSARDAAPVPANVTVVEVLWGGRWWPATIVRREGQRAYIHYDGWNASYDEWVTPDRLRPRQ